MPEPLLTVVIETVARYYSVDPASIVSAERYLSQVTARHTAMYVARLAGSFSYPQIAEAFKRGHHATVMSACKKMAARTLREPAYDRTIKELVREVQGIGLSGGPVKIRPELIALIEERVKAGIYGGSVEDVVDRILCDYFQREMARK